MSLYILTDGLVVLQLFEQFPLVVAEDNLRGRRGIAVLIEVPGSVGGHVDGVMPGHFGEPFLAGAVVPDTVELLFERRGFGREIVDGLRLGVDAADLDQVPVALRYGVDQFSVIAIVIDMVIT